MAYLIDAWIEEGAPRLRISDAQTGNVRLQWTGDKASENESLDGACDPLARKALQRLFRDLVLLSCAGKLNTPASQWRSTSLEDACLRCDACTPAPAPANTWLKARD